MLYAVSRIPTNNNPPHFYKQPTNQNPSSSSPLFMRKLEAEVPSRGTSHKNLTPAQNWAVVCMYRSPPDIYRISVRSSSTLEGVLSSRLVCCRLVLSLSSRLLVSISGLYLWCRSLSSLYQPPPSLSPLVVLSLSLYDVQKLS